jgi:hypothetical protein
VGGVLTPVGGVLTPQSDPAYQTETPPSDNLDADHDDATPLRFRQLVDIIGSPPTPGQAARNIPTELFFAATEEPTSFKEVEQKHHGEVQWQRKSIP